MKTLSRVPVRCIIQTIERLCVDGNVVTFSRVFSGRHIKRNDCQSVRRSSALFVSASPLTIANGRLVVPVMSKRRHGDESGGESDDEGTSEKKLRLLEQIRRELPPVPDMKLEPISEEIRKRKVAVLVAYCGTGYYGLQIQSESKLRTIEGDFYQALENAGLITAENAKDLKTQTGFQRASRTDKGVSAAGNVFSLKMKHPDDAVQRLNRCLPPQIKVLGIIKVTKGFDSKNSVNSRTYLYLLPSYSFASHFEELDTKYRINPETIENVNKLFSLCQGTRNFHNFTSGKLPTDASAKRFVMNMSCGSPFIVDDTEFCVISVRGQSFMLHQIRKMIGLVIAVARGVCGPEVITKKVWGPAKVDIPKAPGLGLMLDKLHYDTYNRKFGNDGMHQPLDWDDYKDEMEAFKLDQVFANIARTEINAMEMKNWIDTLPMHSYDIKTSVRVEETGSAKTETDQSIIPSKTGTGTETGSAKTETDQSNIPSKTGTTLDSEMEKKIVINGTASSSSSENDVINGTASSSSSENDVDRSPIRTDNFINSGKVVTVNEKGNGPDNASVSVNKVVDDGDKAEDAADSDSANRIV